MPDQQTPLADRLGTPIERPLPLPSGNALFGSDVVAETLRAQVRRDQLPLTVSVALPSLVDTNIGESHDEEFEAWQDLSRPRMQAADVARLMLEGMAAGQFYIFTHAGSHARIDRRYREVNAACQQSTAVN